MTGVGIVLLVAAFLVLVAAFVYVSVKSGRVWDAGFDAAQHTHRRAVSGKACSWHRVNPYRRGQS